MSARISIIVPTYNEHDGVGTLIHRIHAAMCEWPYEIIIVDDDSPDGTADAARLLSGQFPVKVVVRRNEKGLATAVVEGMSHVSGEIIVVMDADLQHPPEAINQLVSKIEDGTQLAVASRYAAGGASPGLKSIRKFISRGATNIAHLLLPRSRDVSDPMSGFFAFHRDIVGDVQLKPVGFKILLEIIALGRYKRVAEVPISFGPRQEDESKLNFKQQIDYLKHVFSLMKRTGELARFVKFCLVGASGVGVNLGILWLLTDIGGLFYLASAAISIEISIISNFLLNNFFTFADRRKTGIVSLIKRLLRFNAISVAGIGINLSILWVLTHFVGLYYLLSNFCGIVAATIWNYLANNWWTWAKRR